MSDLPKEPESRGLHYRALDSKVFEILRESPIPMPEWKERVGGRPEGSQDGMRSHIEFLRPPTTSKGSSLTGVNGPDQPVGIVYLWGDERRAVREFIKQNPEYVAYEYEHQGRGSTLAARWDDGFLDLLAQEWGYYRRHEEGED